MPPVSALFGHAKGTRYVSVKGCFTLIPRCKALPCRRLLSFTWELDFPCGSLNRRVSYVVVVNGGGQHPAMRNRVVISAPPNCYREIFRDGADIVAFQPKDVCDGCAHASRGSLMVKTSAAG